MFPSIKVKNNGMAFVARYQGKSASCAYSAEVAARRLATKLWPEHEFELKTLRAEKDPKTGDDIHVYMVSFFQMPAPEIKGGA